MYKNLEEINGNEIIDFLNKKSSDDDFDNVSIIRESYVYENQLIKNDTYILSFTGSFNNWGTDQEIFDNEIKISKNGGIRVWLNEPFEGDGSGEVLEEALTAWLLTHEFNKNPEEEFNSIIENVYDRFSSVTITNKAFLESIIEDLIKAKTYIK